VKPASLTVPARADFVHAASQFVVRTAQHLGVAAASAPLFEVAIVEALANAIKHGARGRDGAMVSCEVERAGTGVRIRIFDDGEGFTPLGRVTLPADPAAVPIAALPESGYGLPIIQSVFHDMEARRENGKFCLELTLEAEVT
jgi:anti-sigma regulatory factor (Ser/Thr protein kinase)